MLLAFVLKGVGLNTLYNTVDLVQMRLTDLVCAFVICLLAGWLVVVQRPISRVGCPTTFVCGRSEIAATTVSLKGVCSCFVVICLSNTLYICNVYNRVGLLRAL